MVGWGYGGDEMSGWAPVCSSQRTCACVVLRVCTECRTECYVRSWGAAGGARGEANLECGNEGRQILTKFLRAARAGKSRIKF